MKRALLGLMACVLLAAAPAHAWADADAPDAGTHGAGTDAAGTGAPGAGAHATGTDAAGTPAIESAGFLFADRTGVDPTRALLMRWVGVMALLALVAGAAWFVLKRGRIPGLMPRRGNMHVVDRLFLGPKRSIQVVQIGTRQLIVGITEMQITTLGELEEGAFVSADSSAGRAAGAPFASFLDSAAARDTE